MTLEDMVTQARKFSRTTESSHSNDVLITLINEGQKQFAMDGYAMWKDDYITLDPKFDVKPNFYFKVILASASASFPINASGSSFNDITGASVAAFIASSLQGTWVAATCGWSSTSWNYYIEIPAETNIQVTSPDGEVYIDVTGMFFGGGSTQATATWLSSFPETCTVKASLPTSFYAIEHVQWDQSTVSAAPFDIFLSPQIRGDPYYYAVKNKDLYLYPVPDGQKLLHVVYRAFPADFGVFSATGSGSFSASSPLDVEVQMAPVFYAASQLAEQNFEPKVADRLFSRYNMMAQKYKQNFLNQNPQMFQNLAAARLPYKVDIQ